MRPYYAMLWNFCENVFELLAVFAKRHKRWVWMTPANPKNRHSLDPYAQRKRLESSQLAREPASQPARKPASQPASQKASQPARHRGGAAGLQETSSEWHGCLAAPQAPRICPEIHGLRQKHFNRILRKSWEVPGILRISLRSY